jgi:protein gp37
MGATSEIEWTDATWNPVTGCTKVSPGCKHCYAETFAERWRGIPGHAYEQGFDLRLWPERLTLPLRWQKPRRIFVNSMSDLFHKDVPESFIDEAFLVMAWATRHTFQVLTKRAERMRRHVNGPIAVGRFLAALQSLSDKMPGFTIPKGTPISGGALCSPHIWLGVSVENQQRAAERIPELQQAVAGLRFLSCEPLLGPLPNLSLSGIGWVIVGGESGPGARPMDPAWVRDIRDQCLAARVPFFFKQWGGVRKATTGRELDGRTWDEMPE